jgi:hypothetical protein
MRRKAASRIFAAARSCEVGGQPAGATQRLIVRDLRYAKTRRVKALATQRRARLSALCEEVARLTIRPELRAEVTADEQHDQQRPAYRRVSIDAAGAPADSMSARQAKTASARASGPRRRDLGLNPPFAIRTSRRPPRGSRRNVPVWVTPAERFQLPTMVDDVSAAGTKRCAAALVQPG